MALARLALKNTKWRLATPPSSFLSHQHTPSGIGSGRAAGWSSQLVNSFTTTTTDHEQSQMETKSDVHGHQVAVSHDDTNKKSKLSHKGKPRRGLWWSRNNNNNDPGLANPSLSDLLPSGLGNAIVQATQNMNRLLENLSPSHLIGRFKEKDECYKVKYHMPGLSKEDVKITIEDGVLVVRGEHKEEEEDSSDDEHWSYASHGYYSTSLLLPEDAKTDEIKAEMKDGVLCINIAKTEGKKKDIKEVHVN